MSILHQSSLNVRGGSRIFQWRWLVLWGPRINGKYPQNVAIIFLNCYTRNASKCHNLEVTMTYLSRVLFLFPAKIPTIFYRAQAGGSGIISHLVYLPKFDTVIYRSCSVAVTTGLGWFSMFLCSSGKKKQLVPNSTTTTTRQVAQFFITRINDMLPSALYGCFRQWRMEMRA